MYLKYAKWDLVYWFLIIFHLLQSFLYEFIFNFIFDFFFNSNF